MRKISKYEFCNRSNIIHNNKYDYSLVDYKNNRTKVNIICKEHGIFEQIPESHMRGFGCKKCSNNHNHTNAEFIIKLYDIFKTKYSYDKTEYISQNKKVIITCDKHGDILKYPQSLLKGSGCAKCESKNYKIDNDEFIKRSKKVHLDVYDYSLVSYINDSTLVKIVCKNHGIFEQTPNSHLSGHGCIYCSGRYRSTKEEFIKKSNIIHNNTYDYKNVIYVNAHKKVEIICNKHGNFEQKPNNHLSGEGCPSCNESKGEIKINEILISKKINYCRQKTFEDCKDKSLLFFDFYLPDKNICIEYDGEFHYKPIFGEINLENTLRRDSIKNKYCKDNNIKLIRIPYTKFKKIKEILDNFLN